METKALEEYIDNLIKQAKKEEWDGLEWAYIEGLQHVLDNTVDGGISESYLEGITYALELLAI